MRGRESQVGRACFFLVRVTACRVPSHFIHNWPSPSACSGHERRGEKCVGLLSVRSRMASTGSQFCATASSAHNCVPVEAIFERHCPLLRIAFQWKRILSNGVHFSSKRASRSIYRSSGSGFCAAAPSAQNGVPVEADSARPPPRRPSCASRRRKLTSVHKPVQGKTNYL